MCNSYESRSVSARVESCKKVRKQIFLPPHVFWDPGSGIRDPGWEKTRIRDKHPGSATLLYSLLERYRYKCSDQLIPKSIFL
jgi:hypothetical protein